MWKLSSISQTRLDRVYILVYPVHFGGVLLYAPANKLFTQMPPKSNCLLFTQGVRAIHSIASVVIHASPSPDICVFAFAVSVACARSLMCQAAAHPPGDGDVCIVSCFRGHCSLPRSRCRRTWRFDMRRLSPFTCTCL